LRPYGDDIDRQLPDVSRLISSSHGVDDLVIISLKPSFAGGWSVCRSHIALFGDLQLGAAIKLARELARDEHQRSNRSVSVEMPGPTSTIVLARYAGATDILAA
jgi:hypothetical protein